MRAAVLAGMVVVVAVGSGCGDNRAGPPDAGPGDECLPRPPIEGELLADPLAIPLPDGCVEGGVAGLVGRWFVSSEDYTSIYGRPRYEQACGRLREHLELEWHHDPEFVLFDTWSDDTRIVRREGNDLDRSAFVTAVCAMPDGSLAGVSGYQFRDISGEPVDPLLEPLVGHPFGWKDELSVGLTPVGSLATRGDGSAIQAYNLVVDDGYAYVAGPGGFDVIDVRDPAHPAAVGHVDGYCNDVRVARSGGHVVAYLGDATTRMIDVTDPSTPTPVAALGVFSHSLQIATRGGQRDLYAIDGQAPAVPVYDISDNLVPVLIGTIVVGSTFQEGVHDLSVDGTTVYANATFAGTVALDTSTGFDTAVEIGRFEPDPPGYSHASWSGVVGGRLIVLTAEESGLGTTDGMAFLRVLDGDRASPGYMTQIGRYQSRREVGLHYFVVVGDRAYIAYYEDGVRVVDLSDPTAPIEVAHYNTWLDANAGTYFGGAFSVRVVDDLIYVADSTAGLVILRDPVLTP